MASHAQFNGRAQVPTPINETVRQYAPQSPERASIKAKLLAMAGDTIDMPAIIGGKECRTGQTATSVMPHDHRHVLGQYHKATRSLVDEAIAAAHEAHREWSGWSFTERAAVFLK